MLSVRIISCVSCGQYCLSREVRIWETKTVQKMPKWGNYLTFYPSSCVFGSRFPKKNLNILRGPIFQIKNKNKFINTLKKVV